MGSIFSAGINYASQQDTNYITQEENQKDRDFNALEAEKQRNWQSDEWQRQYDQQRTEWYRQLAAQQQAQRAQFNYEAEYNSPQNQAKRLSAVGLNPSAMVNQSGQSGFVSAATGNMSSAPSPSVPTGGTVSGSAASAGSGRGFVAPQVNLGSLAEIGTFARDMSEAAKTNKTLQLVLDSMSEDLIGKKLMNDSLEIQNWIAENTKGVKVLQAFEDLHNTMNEIAYRVKLGQNVDADTLLKQAEKFLTDAKKRVSDKQYEHLQLQVDTFMDNFAMEMNVRKSMVQKNNADAAYGFALAKSENELREFKVKNQKLLNTYQGYLNDMAKNDAWISNNTNKERLDKVIAELTEQAKQAGIFTEQHIEALENARKNNQWYELRVLLGPLIGFFNSTVSNAGSIITMTQ